MAENPFEQYPLNQGQDLRTQSMQMRMMMNADRMSQYGMPRTHFAGGRGGMGGDPMLTAMMGQQPDYSAFTYDPQLNAQARAAGVTPLAPNQVKQNVVLPNSGFFGNHPRLSGMLEGGLFGAAATRGSDTWGEGISHVASGLIEGRQARNNLYNRQFAQPFQSANVLEGLQDRVALRQDREAQVQDRRKNLELQDSEIQKNRALAQRAGLPEHTFNMHPLTKSDPGFAVMDTTTGATTYHQNPDYDPTLKSGNEWTGQEANRGIAGQLGIKGPPEAWSQKDWARIEGKKQANALELSVGKAAGDVAAKNAVPGELTPVQREQVTTLRQQLSKLDSKEYVTLVRRQVRNDPNFKDTSGNTSKQSEEVARRISVEKQGYQDQMNKIMNSQEKGSALYYNQQTGQMEKR